MLPVPAHDCGLPFRVCDVHAPCRVDLGSAPAGADQALGSQAQKEAGEAQAQTMSTRGFVNPGGGGFTPDTDNTAPTGGDVAGKPQALFTLPWPPLPGPFIRHALGACLVIAPQATQAPRAVSVIEAEPSRLAQPTPSAPIRHLLHRSETSYACQALRCGTNWQPLLVRTNSSTLIADVDGENGCRGGPWGCLL